MTGSDFFAVASMIFLARAVSEKHALWYCWLFLALALFTKWAA